MRKKLNRQVVTTTTEEGITTEQRVDKQYSFGVEEDYIKLYIRTISVLHDLKGSCASTFNELMKLVDYKNRIVLAPMIKRQIAEQLGFKVNTIDHHITDICKSKLLIREDFNVYKINTYVLGRGRWRQIQEDREALNLKVIFRDGNISFIDEEKEIVEERQELNTPDNVPNFRKVIK